MAQVLIRGLEEAVKQRLKARAARRGRSLEAEARDILRAATLRDEPDPTEAGIGSRIAARFAGLGLDEDIAEQRGQAARPAPF